MTNFAAGAPGCARRAHQKNDLRHYDALPEPIRDLLKIARDNLCSACIGLLLRQQGIQAAAEYLNFTRTHRQAWARRGDRLLQMLVIEEEIRP